MEPVVENQIWPIQTYHTFRGNFYGTARRSINPNCVRHSGSHDLNSREREYMTLEKPMQNQFMPSPTRRTSFMEAKKKPLNNVEPKFSNLGGSATSRLQNQVLLINQDPHALRSQPEVSQKEAEPTSLKINTQIKMDEESSISQPPPQVPKEINSVRTQPQDSTTFRIQTPTVKNEESHGLNNQPQELKDEGSKMYGTVSKVTSEVESNTIRIQVSSQKEDEPNTFRNQPPALKYYGPSTIKTQTHMLPNEDSKSLRSSSSVENLQKPASIANEKSVYDNTIVSFSGEKAEREESENVANSAPVISVERVESFSFEGNTDHLVSPSLQIDSKMTNGHCSEDKPAIAFDPQPRRRLLTNIKNDDSEIPNVEKKEVVQTNNDKQPEIIIASNAKSKRTKAANRENEASKQIENIPAKNINLSVNDNRSNEYDNANSKASSTEKPPHRAGKLHFIADPKSNEIKDPTKGQGISYIKKTTLMLMDYDRVCYACSTANSPTCLFPDRKTGVKYCRKGDNACVTKTFGSGSKFSELLYLIFP